MTVLVESLRSDDGRMNLARKKELRLLLKWWNTYSFFVIQHTVGVLLPFGKAIFKKHSMHPL